MNRVLVVAEHDGRVLSPATAKCVACARTIPTSEVHVVVLADGGTAVAEHAARLGGVVRVLLAASPANAHALAAVWAPQIATLAPAYTHVLGPSTTFGKDLMPRVAAMLGVGQVSDVMSIEGAHRFKRPIYAGNAIVTVDAAPDRILVATVRTASYAPVTEDGGAEIEPVAPACELPAHTRYVGLEADDRAGPDLQTATRVVAGGRGLGSRERFALIEELAEALGAATGASRAAVDSGFVPNDLQVGQTGKIIAPDLYVAVGISGAIQHVTGIKDAKTIVAINKDAESPIFDIADVGLVADLFQAVPELITAIRARRSGHPP
jgi:electron transfer flavoprotein alpha subunit